MKFIIALMAATFWFGVGLAQSTLENIAISKIGDSVLVDIILSAPCQYEHSLTKVVPERIVIDLKKAINNWPQKNYTRLPLKTLSGVRTSQYQETPERIARVVLDVNRPITYRVENLPNGIRIKLPAVTNENEFAIWQARGPKRVTELVSVEKTKEPEKPVQIPKPVVVEKKQTPPDPVKPKAPENLTVKQAAKPVTTTPPIKVAEKIPVEVKKVADKPLAAKNDKPEENTAKPIPPPTPVAETPIKAQPPKAVTVPAPKMGMPLDTLTQRKIVQYEPGGERDPFKSLVGQGASQKTVGKLPAVENLTLVGLLEEDSGDQALFEDAEGNGYILKPNDPVRNGYLVSIQKDKAVFQITEYGWTRTVALDLKLPELK
jgi:hypothetical protein